MKTCGFVNLDKFELNEDIEIKIYCCILKKINESVNTFIFITNEFNNFCYDKVSQFQENYFNLKRICLADFKDFVCLKQDKRRMERLFKLCTGKLVPFMPFEDIIDYELFRDIDFEGKAESKEERLLSYCNYIIVYCKDKEGEKCKKFVSLAKENNIELLFL